MAQVKILPLDALQNMVRHSKGFSFYNACHQFFMCFYSDFRNLRIAYIEKGKDGEIKVVGDNSSVEICDAIKIKKSAFLSEG